MKIFILVFHFLFLIFSCGKIENNSIKIKKPINSKEITMGGADNSIGNEKLPMKCIVSSGMPAQEVIDVCGLPNQVWLEGGMLILSYPIDSVDLGLIDIEEIKITKELRIKDAILLRIGPPFEKPELRLTWKAKTQEEKIKTGVVLNAVKIFIPPMKSILEKI